VDVLISFSRARPFRIVNRRFVAKFHFNSWLHISLGLHVDLESPNVEIHVPFGFVRIGWEGIYIEE
jgi:hypothetical protein